MTERINLLRAMELELAKDIRKAAVRALKKLMVVL
jgi:hypothetical protein